MSIEISHLPRPPAQGLGKGPSAEAPRQEQAPVAHGGGDRVNLTASARQLQALTASLAEVPVVNDARVAELRQVLAEGGYEVNPERIAEKLLDMERALSGLE
jgi:negative regulator of flagellin synthesis FlgM